MFKSYDAWKTTQPDTYDEPPRCHCEQPCDCAGQLTASERLACEIDALIDTAESSADWAHIALLEQQMLDALTEDEIAKILQVHRERS